MSPDIPESAIVEDLRRRNPDAAALGGFAALAARVEPQLLRALRLTLLPWADVSAEGDLWFSDVVQLRGPSTIVLYADALPALRQEAARDPVRLATAAGVISTVHAAADPLVLLEERLIAAALADDGASVEQALYPVIATILEQPRRAGDLSAWALRMLPRLPFAVRTTPAFWTLTFAAQSRSDAGAARIDDVPARPVFDAVFPGATSGRDVGIEIERFGDVLRMRVAPVGADASLTVPATTPIVLRVSSNLPPDVLAVSASWTTVRVAGDSVQVRAVDGRRYQIDSLGATAETAASPMPLGVLAITAGDIRMSGYLVSPTTFVTIAVEQTREGDHVTVQSGDLTWGATLTRVDLHEHVAIGKLEGPILGLAPFDVSSAADVVGTASAELILAGGARINGTVSLAAPQRLYYFSSTERPQPGSGGSPVLIDGRVLGHLSERKAGGAGSATENDTYTITGVSVVQELLASRASAEAAPDRAESRALVIGVDEYPRDRPTLPGGEDGARLIGDCLRSLGMDVSVLLSPTEDDAVRALEALTTARPVRRLIIYFSGPVRWLEEERVALLPDPKTDNPPGIDLQEWARALCASGVTERAVVITNEGARSAQVQRAPPRRPPVIARRGERAPLLLFMSAHADATRAPEGRSEFDRAVGDALRGAAANVDGKVRSHEIARYVRERMAGVGVTVDLHTVGDAFVVVTDEELRRVPAASGKEEAGGDPALQARAESARLRIERLVDPDAEVMTAIDNPDASVVQSWVEERGTPTPGRRWWQFSEKFGPQDWLGWTRSIFSWTDSRRRHPIVRPSAVTFDPLPNSAVVAVVGNFGTGLYGAPVIANTIRQDPRYDLLLHLGGIFYSGNEKEVQERFLAFWPREAAAINRALNGNHEMYSGGDGYFRQVLPAFQQASSYFAIANDYWVIVGLDTAYTDQTIDDEQYRWLEEVLASARDRQVMICSHHPVIREPFDPSRTPVLAQVMQPLLTQRRITLWIWAWHHYCALYDPHPQWRFTARCAGNGGIPTPRVVVPTEVEWEGRVGRVGWRRLAAPGDGPSCLVLDGPNQYVSGGDQERFAPHGFITYRFEGPLLREEVRLADGTVLRTTLIGKGAVA